MRTGIFRDLAESAAAIGALVYGLGWVFAFTFYARLGVHPEDVGLDFTFALSRTAFLVAGTLAAAAIGVVFLQIHTAVGKGRNGDLATFHRVVYVWTVGVAALMLTLGYGTWARDFTFDAEIWKVDLAGNGFSLAAKSIVTAALLMTLVSNVLLLLRASGYRAMTPEGPRLDDEPSVPHLYAFIASIVLVAGVAIAALGYTTAADVEQGSDLDVWLLRVDHVVVQERPAVTEGSSASAASTAKCAQLLGTADGMHVLRVDDEVVRIPVEGYLLRTVDDCALGWGGA